MIMVSAIILVSVFYAINFLERKESKVYINEIVHDGPPFVTLTKRNFIMIFKHSYPTNGPFNGQQDKIFSL
jgi:hypothetical protein